MSQLQIGDQVQTSIDTHLNCFYLIWANFTKNSFDCVPEEMV